jgi:hypothetical protein
MDWRAGRARRPVPTADSTAEQVRHLLDKQKNELLYQFGKLRARASELQKRQDQLDQRRHRLETLRELELLRLLDVQDQVRQMQSQAKFVMPSTTTIEQLKQCIGDLKARSRRL